MLSRILLAAYAGGALDTLADDHDLDLAARLELLTRLLCDVLAMTVKEAQHHAAALVSPAASASPRLGDIMQRGAEAFAQWQANPAGFVLDDFRSLVAACAARPLFLPVSRPQCSMARTGFASKAEPPVTSRANRSAARAM
jgi:hypothetical protein